MLDYALGVSTTEDRTQDSSDNCWALDVCTAIQAAWYEPVTSCVEVCWR